MSATMRRILRAAPDRAQAELAGRGSRAARDRASSWAPARLGACSVEVARVLARRRPPRRGPSIGTRLVRITWSGVAGPCCAIVATSSRRAKARLAASECAASEHRAARRARRRRGAARRARGAAASRPRRPATARNVPRAVAPPGTPRPGRPARSCARRIPARCRRRRRCRGSAAPCRWCAALASRAKSSRAQPRQVEARHHVGNDDHVVAVDLADALARRRRCW